MPGKPWTDASERLLLLSIIHVTCPAPPKWDQIADLMGEGYTASAVRFVFDTQETYNELTSRSQRWTKLRKDCKEQFGELDAGAKKAAPRKPKPSTSDGRTPGSATGKRKANKQPEANNDDETEHVVKKVKTEEKEESVEKEDSE